MSVRDVILGIYAVAWLADVVINAWRLGTVPTELWAVLGAGEGALIAIFRADNHAARKRVPPEEQSEE